METMPIRKLPVGIQDFTKLREENFLYVDKTALVYRMAVSGNPIFLSRPRRFGKSLLLSTLEAYFLGRKEVFKGLAIEQLEKEEDTDDAGTTNFLEDMIEKKEKTAWMIRAYLEK